MKNPVEAGAVPKFPKEIVLLGEMTKHRSCYDVHYYDLSLEINPLTQQLFGSVVVYAKMLEDADTIQLDLDDRFTILDLKDENTGHPYSYKREERAVFFSVEKKKGELLKVYLKYTGSPRIAKKPPWEGGWVWKKDKNNNPWIGVACESDGASLWWPLKDHIADEPDSIRMHYTVPKNLVAVGNGQFEGKEEGLETTTYNWYVSYPINTYNVTVYVGDFLKIQDEYIGGDGEVLPISHYVLRENYDKAKAHFRQIHKILNVFEKYFGKYPWYNDGFKLVESPYAGMEHQTAIAYGNEYNNFLDSTDYIILHETAHEWWGNSVSAKDMADVWLHEGFATYAEALYFEELNDYEFYKKYLAAYRVMIKNEYPVVGIRDRRWFDSVLNGDVYMKGAWVLHSLRSQINQDTLFFDILKSFCEENRMKIIETQDFIDYVHYRTEKDFNWFFNQYLYSNFSPEFEYWITNSGKVYYRWNRVNEDFNQLKIKVVVGESSFFVTPSTETKHFQLKDKINGKWRFEVDYSALFLVKQNENLK